jgi:MscS family membrane protein
MSLSELIVGALNGEGVGSGLGVSGWRYLAAFLILLGSFFFKKLFDLFVSRKILQLTQKTSFHYDEKIVRAINPPISALFLVVGVFLALNSLALPSEPIDFRKISLEAVRVAIAVIAVWSAFRLTDVLGHWLGDLLSHRDEVIRLQFVPLIKKSLRVFVLIVGSLLIVQNLGYSVGSLVAGLGIGGLAVALAAQESLANFFGSIVLLADRPFKVGDWVQVGEVDGNVEELGFRSTRIRTWSRSLVTIPNKTLANSVVENWSAMPNRRVRQVIGITYDTPAEKVRAFVDGVRSIISSHKGVNQDFHLVNFTDFNSSSLDVLVYYFTDTTRWAEHLAIREEINLSFMRLAEGLGVSFAFPARTLYWGPGQRPEPQSSLPQ